MNMPEPLPIVWPANWPSMASSARYFVARDGVVFSFRKERLAPLAQQPDKDGYLYVLVRLSTGKRRKLRVHRAVCEAFNGQKPLGKEVRHRDGNKLNNRASNLLWGTQLENAADREEHGRTARGSRNGAYTKPHTRRRGIENGNSKLTPEQILSILHDSRSQSKIALTHGVTQSLVSQIKLGRIWTHITGLPRYISEEKRK